MSRILKRALWLLTLSLILFYVERCIFDFIVCIVYIVLTKAKTNTCIDVFISVVFVCTFIIINIIMFLECLWLSYKASLILVYDFN